jgi:thioesterase domain-containing protein
MLALFDTPLPQVFGGIDLDDDSRFFCDMLKFASHFSGTDLRIDYDELATLDPETRFQRTLVEARRQGTISAEAPEDYIRRLVHVGKANVRVIQSYEPRPFGQAVALFVPATKGGLSEVAGQTVPEESDLGWGTQIGQTVEIREVPGDHFGMMLGPGAAELAQHLDALMKAIVAGSVR